MHLKLNLYSVVFSVLLLLLFDKVRSEHEDRLNVSYGHDSEHIMDIYIPEDKNQILVKILLLVHGGAWSTGSKEDVKPFLDFFLKEFPNYAIANMNYRLGTESSPGYAKQLNDIEQALKFLETDLNITSPQFALIGVSAGAHLSLLYAYGFDMSGYVKAIVNIVGPTDFTDPVYALNPVFNKFFFPLMGPYLYTQNPDLYKEASPATYVSDLSAPTICFYGLKDAIVPISQGKILKKKLENATVVHEYYTYPGGHHFDWSKKDKADVHSKAATFLNANFFPDREANVDPER